MTSLSQMLGLRDSARAEANRAVSATRARLLRTDDFKGFVKSYRPLDEDDKTLLPGQGKKVLVSSTDLLADLTGALSRLLDVEATLSQANRAAVANVEIKDRVILADVPGTYLIFLEKQLDLLLSLIDGFPVHDPERDWHEDPNRGLYVSDPVETVSQTKTPRPLVLAAATQYHPAQVQVINEDVIRGFWTTIDFSSALPATEKKELRDRVVALRDAVNAARDRANQVQVRNVEYGKDVFDFLLGR